jgi:hypothetical protein
MHRVSRDRRSNNIQRLLTDARELDADINHAVAIERFCHLRETIPFLYERDIAAACSSMRLRAL